MKQITTIVVFLLISGSALADSVNTRLFRFTDTLETLSLEDANDVDAELQNYRAFLRVSYDYVREPFIGIDPVRSTQVFPLVDSIHTVGLGATFRVSNRLTIGVDAPLHYTTLSNVFASGNFSDSDWSLGDIDFRIKYRITGNDEDRKFHAGIMPYVSLPTGKDEYFTTDDSYIIGGKALLSYLIHSRVKLMANLGYAYASNAEYLSVDRTKRFELAAGATWDFADKFALVGEAISGITYPGYDSDQNPLEYRLALRADVGRSKLFAGLGLEPFRGDERSSDLVFFGGVKVPFGAVREEKPAPVVAVVEPEPAPEPEPTPEPEPAPVVVQEIVEYVDPIYFDVNKDVIKSESYQVIDHVIGLINKYDDVTVVQVNAHTDSDGSDAYNLDLSARRARSVKQYLINNGVDAGKIRSAGYGESSPKVPNTSRENKAQNRRVEFELTGQNTNVKIINR